MRVTPEIASVPAGPEFEVTITCTPGALDPTQLAILQERIDHARDVAQRFLATGLVPLPADIEAAIGDVLEARRRIRALQPGGTTMQAIRLRGELFAAIDALASLTEETPNV